MCTDCDWDRFWRVFFRGLLFSISIAAFGLSGMLLIPFRCPSFEDDFGFLLVTSATLSGLNDGLAFPEKLGLCMLAVCSLVVPLFGIAFDCDAYKFRRSSSTKWGLLGATFLYLCSPLMPFGMWWIVFQNTYVTSVLKWTTSGYFLILGILTLFAVVDIGYLAVRSTDAYVRDALSSEPEGGTRLRELEWIDIHLSPIPSSLRPGDEHAPQWRLLKAFWRSIKAPIRRNRSSRARQGGARSNNVNLGPVQPQPAGH